jgi:hypothetical protein
MFTNASTRYAFAITQPSNQRFGRSQFGILKADAGVRPERVVIADDPSYVSLNAGFGETNRSLIAQERPSEALKCFP